MVSVEYVVCVDVGAKVRSFAEQLGFDAVGFAAADVPLEEEYERYRAFVESGKHGTMQYLAESGPVRQRLDTPDILRGARSVVVLARRYDRDDDANDSPLSQRIARYARGRDYHNVVRRKLRQLAAYLRRFGTTEEPVEARPMCDDVPVLERAWAARAGLGFIGKNGLLIVPGVGSMVLLGEVVTTLSLPAGTPIAERCGSCTRCLEACPTAAFEAPFVLDPRACVSYWTIEHRGPIPEDVRPHIGSRLFGCDDCQTVCPFNAGKHRPAAQTSSFEPHPRWAELALRDLLDVERFPEIAQGSPVYRATAEGLARNAALVMANEGTDEEALERAARTHPVEAVREIAVWARRRPR